MDKLEVYKKAIVDFLEDYAHEMYSNDPSDIETQVIQDTINHHYQLVRLGWTKGRHIYFPILHIDIKYEKVWIQINNTEEMVGDRLIEKGIPKKEIVLAFHPEHLRQYTGFAIA